VCFGVLFFMSEIHFLFLLIFILFWLACIYLCCWCFPLGVYASRFQSRTVLGKNDIFLLSIREDGIWNDLLCDFLVFRPVGISLFSLLMATSSLSILYETYLNFGFTIHWACRTKTKIA
jgi:hypothetical protein